MRRKEVRIGGMTRVQRARRFWKAHGRSRTHLVLLHAFASNPSLTWTPEGLSIWYGLRMDRTARVLDELLQAGIILPAVRPWRGYRWNRRHDWAAPTDGSILRAVCDRLAAVAPEARSLISADVEPA